MIPIAAYQLDLVAGAYLSFFKHCKIKSGPAALQKPPDDVGTSELDAQLVARQPRFRHHQLSLADAEAITNIDPLFKHSFRRKVFAKHSIRQLHVREFFCPKL